MARFDERSGNLYVTELGRVASHFYIRHASIVVFNEVLKPNMNEAEVCTMGTGLPYHYTDVQLWNTTPNGFIDDEKYLKLMDV